MTLSTSRQQFLACESQGPEEIQYGRRGGIFVSTIVCSCFVVLALLSAALVGAIVYFVTYFKLSQGTADFWDETGPFGHNSFSAKDSRLPQHIVPNFYRLKLITDLENSTFNGEVYITIRATKNVKEIILHAKDLSISKNVKLIEQINEKVETLHETRRIKRQIDDKATLNSTKSNTSNTDFGTFTQTNSSSIENATEITNTESDTTIPPEGNDTQNTTDNIKLKSADIVNASLDSLNALSDTINATAEDKTTISNDVNKVENQVTHGSVRSVKILSVKTDKSKDELILSLGSPLRTGVDYILQISFEGQISDSLTGFYKSSYIDENRKHKKLAVTQFEPVSARAAFPCFDEPAFKAKFEISIAHPANVIALSNMKVISQEDIDDKPGWKWTHFDRSVSMSTYLVAYILSDFTSANTTYESKNNSTKSIKIWARRELINKTNYALSITPKLLDYYEDLFGVPYALDKLDLVAIPDFSSGAMENWGLSTFRETALLFDEKENVPREKQNVAIDVAHELAHQWFGNLVTMQWWTDLWLNEGFATYIEYVGVNHIEPSWNMLEYFTRDKMDLLKTDALKNTSPVSRVVTDASEISQKFDEISYAKGASLIRMLNHTISEPLFRKGLILYLNKWNYTNAEENDLWTAMSEAIESDPSLQGISIVQFMNTWTRQAGYPVIQVKRDYNSGQVTFSQSLFSTAKDPYPKMLNQIWHIPVSYALTESGTEEWSSKPKLWLKERTLKKMISANETQALYVNVDAIGYYRVNYDTKNWELLNEALKNNKIKAPVTRAQLIDDAFNLAKVSKLNYKTALDLTTYVINGEDYKIVWEMLLNNMGFLKYNLKTLPFYSYFQDYIRKLISKQLSNLNYGLDKPKDDNEAFLIENLLMWDCYVESPRCVKWATSQFSNWMNQPDNNTIPSYLRPLVYNMGIRHGGRSEFEFLWQVFQNSTDPNVKTIIITNLPSTREESLISLLLERSLTVIPSQYAPAAWSVDSTIGSKLAQDFLMNNWDKVYNKFTKMDSFMFSAILNGAFGFIATTSDLNRFKTFALEHKAELKPMSQTLQKLVDTANLRINWLERHSLTIEKWLKEYITESTTTSTPDDSVVQATEANREKQDDLNSNANITVPNNLTQT